VPETFKPAMEARRRRTRPSALQPSSDVEGRSVPSEHVHSHLAEKGVLSPTPSSANIEGQPGRWENESLDMSDSEISVHTPQRISSFSGQIYITHPQTDGQNDSHSAHSFSESMQRHTRRHEDLTQSTASAHVPLHHEMRTFHPLAESESQLPSMTQTNAERLSRHIGPLPDRHSLTNHSPADDHRSPLGRISPLTATEGNGRIPTIQQTLGSRVTNEGGRNRRRASDSRRSQTGNGNQTDMI
jgi:hypothetical protein